jgi:hypothetical protein
LEIYAKAGFDSLLRQKGVTSAKSSILSHIKVAIIVPYGRFLLLPRDFKPIHKETQLS